MKRLKEIITSKKHIKRIVIVWLAILILMSMLIGWNNFLAMFVWNNIVLAIITTGLYAFLLYIMAVLGMNPVIEGARTLFRGDHSEDKDNK